METRKPLWCAVMTIGLLSVCFPALAQDELDLSDMSLESLMNLRVSSVSRNLEELKGSAAAIYVITQEDIRRSGMTDLAELFRMVPGLNVAQINSSTWAVSARGFNAQYAAKLLVLIDGRTVYDPSFSGVYWYMQNLVMEDIERIEIIRGPGATMWGANAVNGVISIRMKPAIDTQGGLLAANLGTERPGEGAFRYGGTAGAKTSYRLYGRQTTRSGLDADGADAWNLTSAGIRVDWKPSRSDSFTFETEMQRGVRGSQQQLLTSFSPLTFEREGLRTNRSGYFRSQWDHSFGADSGLIFRFYVSKVEYRDYGEAKVQSVDFDFQHNFRLGRQNITWGFGHRAVTDEYPFLLAAGMTPPSAVTHLDSIFVQDKIELLRDRLHLTLGSKFEHNTLAGRNIQPSARLSWVPTARHSVWVSASRAVHATSRVERGAHAILRAFDAGPIFGLAEAFGQESARSEGLMAYETGYRYQANRRVWTDVSLFYNVYDHLSTVEPGTPYITSQPAPTHLVAPQYFQNSTNGTTYGLETAVNYKATDIWTLRGSYSLLQMRLHGASAGATAQNIAGQSPSHQIDVSSFLHLSRSLDLSGHAYFVGALRFYNVPSYTRVDTNLRWTGFEKLELSLIGQNLLGSHLEYGETLSPSNPVHRSVYGKVAWRF